MSRVIVEHVHDTAAGVFRVVHAEAVTHSQQVISDGAPIWQCPRGICDGSGGVPNPELADLDDEERETVPAQVACACVTDGAGPVPMLEQVTEYRDVRNVVWADDDEQWQTRGGKPLSAEKIVAEQQRQLKEAIDAQAEVEDTPAPVSLLPEGTDPIPL